MPPVYNWVVQCLVLMATLAMSLIVHGAVVEKGGAKKPAEPDSKTKSKVSSTVSFEDLLVQGKYHFSDEAVTTVEEDKVLDALLGVRKDFKDRMKRSASRR